MATTDTQLLRDRLQRILSRHSRLAGPAMLAPVLPAVAPWWIVAALTRSLGGRLEPQATNRSMIEYAPVVGARPRANLQTHGRAEDVFRLTTDADGWRGSARLDEADVLAFGDSFAFGYGVDDADLFCERVDGVSVKPIAGPAYSMVHSLLWMRQLRRHLDGRLVVWFVYCGNDLADNLHPNIGKYRMPFVRERNGGWELVTDHVTDRPWTFTTTTRSAEQETEDLCRESSHLAQRAYAAAEFLIRCAADLCRHAGAQLAVVSIPDTALVRSSTTGTDRPARTGDPTLADQRLSAAAERHGVRFMAMRGRLGAKQYWRHDMHWNASGHQAAAAVVKELWESEQTGRSADGTSRSDSTGTGLR